MTHEEFIEQLKRHEGLKLFPYFCSAGKMTIGYGRNLEDVGITKEEAELLLEGDIVKAVVALDVAKGDKMMYLNDTRKFVLTNMCFNLGLTRLLKFKKMWQAIDNKDFETAAIEMLDSKWASQVGFRALELAEMMRSGEYKENPRIISSQPSGSSRGKG